MMVMAGAGVWGGSKAVSAGRSAVLWPSAGGPATHPAAQPATHLSLIMTSSEDNGNGNGNSLKLYYSCNSYYSQRVSLRRCKGALQVVKGGWSARGQHGPGIYIWSHDTVVGCNSDIWCIMASEWQISRSGGSSQSSFLPLRASRQGTLCNRIQTPIACHWTVTCSYFIGCFYCSRLNLLSAKK